MDFVSTLSTILFIVMGQMELSRVGITKIGRNITLPSNFQMLSLQEIKHMMEKYLCMRSAMIGNRVNMQIRIL